MTDAAPRPRRWLRWLRRLALLAVLLVVALRLALPLLLPPILRSVGRSQGLALGYEKLDLSLLGGSLELWHLDARPLAEEGEDAAPPLLHLEYAELDIDVSALLTGTLRVHRVEVDGLDAWLRRDAAGEWELARLFATDGESEDEPEDEDEDRPDPRAERDAEPRPIDLGSPLEIQAVRVQDVVVHLLDESCAPALDTSLHLAVRVSDVGHAVRPTRLSVEARCAGILDLFLLEGEGRSGGPQADLDLDLVLSTLQLAPLAGWLEPLGIRPHARHLDARLALDLHAEAADESGRELAARLALRDVALLADSVEAAALDEVRIEADGLSALGASLPTALVRGVRGRAERLADGTLRVAGIDLLPVAGTPGEGEPVRDEPEAAPGAPFALDVPEVRLEAFAFSFEDAGVVPATNLELELERLTLGPLRAGGEAGGPARLDLALRAPGVVESLALTGELDPFAARKRVDLELTLEGIAPDRARPYLASAGIESELEDGRLTLRLGAGVATDEAGRTSARVELAQLSFEDGEQLLGLGRLGADLELDPDSGTTRVREVELSGLRLPAERDAEGRLHLLGLVLGGAPAASSPAGASLPPAGAAASEAPPAGADDPAAPQEPAPTRLAIDRVAWTDTTLIWRDRALEPELGLVIDDLGLVLEGLVLGDESDADLEAWFRSDAIGDELRLAADLRTRPGPLDLEAGLRVTGRGLDLATFQPYLDGLGIEERWEDAELDLTVDADVRQEGQVLRASAALSGVRLASGGKDLLALERLEVPSLSVGPEGIDLEPVRISAPTASLARDAEGGLLALGMRIAPAAEGAGEPAPGAGDPAPGQEAAGQGAPASATPPATNGAESSSSLRLAGLVLEGARVSWSDALAGVDTALVAGLELGELRLGGEAPPAPLELTLGLEGALEQLALRGELTPDPARPAASLRLELRGLRAGPLAAYLPPGTELTLDDGRLDLGIEAAVEPAAEGGRSVRLELVELDYRDGDQGPSLLAMDRLALVAPRVDPAGAWFEVGELVLEGLELDARRTTPTRLELLGLALDAPPERTSRADSSGPAARPAALAGAAPAAAAPARAVPTVRIDRLDLGIDRLGFLDEAHPGAVPLEAHLHLVADRPLTLLGPDPEQLEPLELAVRGGAAPVLDEVDTRIVLDPWAAEPALDLDLALRGLRGAGLAELLPDLEGTLRDEGLEGGSFEAHLTGVLRARRRGPLELDLGAGFGLEVALEDVALRGGSDEILLGLEALRVEARSIRPGTGEVWIETVEVVEPRGRVRRSAEGLHVAGLRIAAAAEPGVEEPAGEDPSVAGELPAEQPAGEVPLAPPAGPSGPSGEIRVDRLIVSGIDFTFRDDSFDPPMVLPLTGLDVEVKRFTTRALTEPLPLSARLALYGGDVELPERRTGTLVGGMLGALGSAVTFSGREYATEQRPAFDEIAAQASLTLYPRPEGWVRARVSGLELPNFAGAARQGGVEIGDGLMSETLLLNFREDGTLRIDSDTRFSHLSLSEPPGGPISRYLKLPAPLDTVLFVLKDDQGDIQLPISFSMPEGNVSVAAATRTASELLLELIAGALASSPMRIVGGVLDFAGLQQDTTVSLEDLEPVRLEYGPGLSRVDDEQLALLEPLLAAMRRDATLVLVLEHGLGGGDLARVAELANPSLEDCHAIAEQLRGRKASLLREREEAVSRASAAFAIGDLPGAEAASRAVAELDGELGRTEQALDRVLERLRPGAERGQARRTRSAALELARGRLAALEELLQDSPITAISQRVDVRRPRFRTPEGEAGGHVLATLRRRR